MKIENNSFFGATKNIQIVNSCLVAKEGPNMVSKFGLGGLNINYDSVLTTKQTLKSDSRDTPIMYGFLGTNITFLAIIPTFNTSSSYVSNCSGTTNTNYIEYYFEDEPLVRRTFTDILILSGNEDHRIPQIYLYNPTPNTVTLDIMAANLDENEISTSLVPSYTELRGLAYSSIRTDTIYNSQYTGSTQFEIYDISGNLQMIIPYNKIDIIHIANELLTVSTHYDDNIQLYFLSSFNALQALSRMNWALEGSISRYATFSYPGLDTTAPTVTYKPYSIPQPMSPTIPFTSGGTISKEDIIWRFVNTVIDYDNNGVVRDGVINNNDLDLLITKNSTGEQFSGITSDGSYSVTFISRDLAGNQSTSTKQIVVDSTSPTIIYNSGLTSDTQYRILLANTTMDLTGDTQTPGAILKDDIRRYYLNYIWDDVDGIITNSAMTVAITSGNTTYTSITALGYYNLNFSVFDSAGNEATSYTLLNVVESVAPIIYYNFTGDTYYMSVGAGLTSADIITYTVSAVTDNYDGNIPITNIILSGTTFPISSVDTYSLTYTVSDSSGNETTDTKDLVITL